MGSPHCFVQGSRRSLHSICINEKQAWQDNGLIFTTPDKFKFLLMILFGTCSLSASKACFWPGAATQTFTSTTQTTVTSTVPKQSVISGMHVGKRLAHEGTTLPVFPGRLVGMLGYLCRRHTHSGGSCCSATEWFFLSTMSTALAAGVLLRDLQCSSILHCCRGEMSVPEGYEWRCQAALRYSKATKADEVQVSPNHLASTTAGHR